MSKNITFSMIKPDGVEDGHIGPIIDKICKAGFKILALKLTQLTKRDAKSFYSIHSEKPFFNDLVDYMISGPVMVQVLEGENAIERNRELMGATNPAEADEGTNRKDYATIIEKNTVHGSDGPDTAKEEISFFFG